MAAVVVPRWHEPAPVFVDVPREEALRLATRAARQLERELISTEQALRDKEMARRRRWNSRWWVRLLPVLKEDTSPGSVDVWDTGRGDVLTGLDDVFFLTWLENHARDARRFAAQARHTLAGTLSVEQKLLNVLHRYDQGGPRTARVSLVTPLSTFAERLPRAENVRYFALDFIRARGYPFAASYTEHRSHLPGL